MPSYLDLILIAVVLISALLAMVRGFTREILAIGSWIAAAGAAYAFHPLALPLVKPYIAKDSIALAVAVGAIFLVTLIVVSLITVRISDMILDSKIGALDRSLGFVFGAGRGFLLCTIAFVFFAFLVPEKSYPSWVQDSKTRPLLEATGNSLQALLPDNLDQSLGKMLKRDQRPANDEPPAETDERNTTQPAPARPQQRGQTQTRPDNSPQSIDALLGAQSSGTRR
jgi:membrane protein required for colicin V production